MEAISDASGERPDSATLVLPRRVCAAPMMDWTDRHCRRFFRALAPHALLYTEMVVADAVLKGQRERLLGFDPIEQPLALQLGGSDAGKLAAAARIAEDWGYDEVNLNVGCPSERVQNATFGACLMAQPRLVADCIAAMRQSVNIPVTVKCRIGIDDDDSYEFLLNFIDTVAATGCDTFIVHARKAILSGLSPKQNRDIPPLNYPTVWRLKKERPSLVVVINGGIKTVQDVRIQWAHTDGVMIGREAYHNPYFLGELDRLSGSVTAVLPEPSEVVRTLAPYISAQLARGERLQSMTRHLLGLYAHRPGARAYRRVLSERAHRADAGIAVLEAAVRAAEAASA
jgi:tRNA-dihydrouridine synthase A